MSAFWLCKGPKFDKWQGNLTNEFVVAALEFSRPDKKTYTNFNLNFDRLVFISNCSFDVQTAINFQIDTAKDDGVQNIPKLSRTLKNH